jgi:hypothetical protein
MLKLSVLTQVHVLLEAKAQRQRGREKTLKMSEFLKKKNAVCVFIRPSPFHALWKQKISSLHVAKRRNSPSGPNPLYKSTKTFDTQF